MQVEKDKVVLFHYRLSNVAGDELESSESDEPMAALIGYGNMLPAMEAAMIGKERHDKFPLTLPPEKAYGLRQDNAQQRVPIKHLLSDGKKKAKFRVGQHVRINTEKGARNATIVKLGKFNVDVDTNHPLAGQTLTFDISIVDIRDATAEEISHGHAHGVGGHHH